jgi:hypothetical protein
VFRGNSITRAKEVIAKAFPSEGANAVPATTVLSMLQRLCLPDTVDNFLALRSAPVSGAAEGVRTLPFS